MKDNTYTIIPQSSAAEIRELHAEIIAAARTSLTKAICIRELLTQEKARLRHGEWLAWVRANLPFSDDTARNYMRVYAKRDQIPNSSEFGLADAYRLLNPPAEPTQLSSDDSCSRQDDFIVEVTAHIFHSQGRSFTVRDVIDLQRSLASRRAA